MSESETPADAPEPFDPTPAPSPAPIPPATIEAEVSCRHCGYLLRGLADTGNCPECGTPVAHSTVSDELRFADPAWLRLVHLAVRLIFWQMVINVAATIAYLLALSAWGSAGNPVLVLLIGLAAQSVGLIGTWLLCVPNPADQHPVAPVTRILARTGVSISVGLSVVNLFVQAYWTLNISREALLGINLLASAAQLVTTVSQLLIIATLARRIPDAAMGRRASFLSRALGICYSGLLASALVTSFVGVSSSTTMLAMGCVNILFVLPAIIFVIMNFFLLIRLSKALKKQYQLALQEPHLPTSGEPPFA